eukprot:5607871-Pyramimonas_sp.AAC.1
MRKISFGVASWGGDTQKKKKRRNHRLPTVRPDSLDLRWTPLPGARTATGAAPEASPGRSSADPRKTRGASK